MIIVFHLSVCSSGTGRMIHTVWRDRSKGNIGCGIPRYVTRKCIQLMLQNNYTCSITHSFTMLNVWHVFTTISKYLKSILKYSINSITIHSTKIKYRLISVECPLSLNDTLLLQSTFTVCPGHTFMHVLMNTIFLNIGLFQSVFPPPPATYLHLQLVDLIVWHHCFVAEVWHHLSPAAWAEADRRRALRFGDRAEGHAGGWERWGRGVSGVLVPGEHFYSSLIVMCSAISTRLTTSFGVNSRNSLENDEIFREVVTCVQIFFPSQ